MTRPSIEFLRFQKDHPCRPPYWRWERARKLKEMKRKPVGKGREDPWVVRCLRFQKALDDAKDEMDRCTAYEKAGPLGIAYDVWDEISSTSNGCRAELEARILANQPFEEIGQKLSMSAEATAAYEAAFFNVTDRLDNEGYIVHQAIGDRLHQGLSDRDFPLLLKAFAYFSHSAPVVDALISTFPQGRESVAVADVGAYFASDTRWNMARKASLASRMLGLNSMSHIQLLEIVARIEEATGGSGTGANSNYLENLKALMGNIPMVFGHNVQVNTLHNGMELKSAEQAQLAAGHQVPALEESAEFTFPDKTKPPEPPHQ